MVATASKHKHVCTLRPQGRGGARRIRLLTGRERDVLAGLAAGFDNRAIAGELGISEATVKAHITRLFAKLGVTSRIQAVLIVLEHVADCAELDLCAEAGADSGSAGMQPPGAA